MKAIIATTAILLFTLVLAVPRDDVVCTPQQVVTNNNLFVTLSSSLYKYSLPDLNLQQTSAGELVCYPGTASGNKVTFGNDQQNTKSISFDVSNLASTKSNTPAPFSTPYFIAFGGGSVTEGEDTYTYTTGALVHTKNGVEVERLAIPTTDNSAAYISFDNQVENRIHLATRTTQGRGGSALTYYAITKSPLALVRCGKLLPRTTNSGCPVAPTGCGVDVLLDIFIQNDIVSYVVSIAVDTDFQVTLFSYDARCDTLQQILIGSSLPSTVRCNSVVSSTCGTAAPTSLAPTTTGAPTTAPSSSAPSSSAPSPSAVGPQNESGENFAKESSDASTKVAGVLGAAAIAAAAALV
ncbi:ribosomal protein S3 [Acrasis kona]|uniref:Ribosomal protein S3 n=1 Tax=Acrasis kona TaxID=1008807 RepID=A0AAW2ZJI9_9EUKA